MMLAPPTVSPGQPPRVDTSPPASSQRVWRLRPAAILVAVLLILARPLPGTAGQHDTLVLCIDSPLASFDPTAFRDRTTQSVLKNIFDSLTALGPDMQVVPQLAVSWQRLDELTWQFALRRDVVWHDGTPFTAADVKFTLDRVVRNAGMDGATSPRQALLAPIHTVTVIDNHTVRIATEPAWPILPLMLSLQEMVPRAYIEAVGAAGFRRRPIGTGPYRLVDHQEGKQLVLERFSGYYAERDPAGQGQRPARLVVEVVPLKAEQIARLKTGTCDVVADVPASAIALLNGINGIRVLASPPTKSVFAEINCLRPPFDDPRLRRALNLAIDKNAVVRHTLMGRGAVLPTVVLPHGFAYHPELAPYPYDPQQARLVIEAAPWPSAPRVTIYCAQAQREFASLIAGHLAKAGLTPGVHAIAAPRPEVAGVKAPWDIFVGSWGNATLDPTDILDPKFKSAAAGNDSGYSNAEVDGLLDLAGRSGDSQLRRQCYLKAQEIIHRDAPMIFGYAATEFYAVSQKVLRFVPPVNGMLAMHDVLLQPKESVP